MSYSQLCRGFPALAGGLCLILAGCRSPAGELSVTAPASAALTPGAVYAWAPIPARAPGHDLDIGSAALGAKIKAAVDASLAAKGYRQTADPGNAALLVVYYVGLRVQAATRVAPNEGSSNNIVCHMNACPNAWGLYGPPPADRRIVNDVQGDLVLVITDRTTGKLAWRAASRRRVTQADAAQESVNALVADMTRSLPGPSRPS